MTAVLAARMQRFMALDWIALFIDSRAPTPPSFDHADESVDQANQRRCDTASCDVPVMPLNLTLAELQGRC